MDAILRSLLENASGAGAYLTVFGVLVACGLGVPLPEDVSLILGGYLAHSGAAHLPIMMAVGFCGILAGDSLIFFAGRRVGENVSGRGLLSRVVTPAKRAKVEHLFERHGTKIVMIARFMPGVRAVTYFTAGSTQMRYLTFIFWDGLAALGSAPLFVFLGYHFGGELEQLIEGVKHGQFAVLGTLAAVAIAYGLYRWNRNIAAKKELELEKQKALASTSAPASAGPSSAVEPPAARSSTFSNEPSFVARSPETRTR